MQGETKTVKGSYVREAEARPSKGSPEDNRRWESCTVALQARQGEQSSSYENAGLPPITGVQSRNPNEGSLELL